MIRQKLSTKSGYLTLLVLSRSPVWPIPGPASSRAQRSHNCTLPAGLLPYLDRLEPSPAGAC